MRIISVECFFNSVSFFDKLLLTDFSAPQFPTAGGRAVSQQSISVGGHHLHLLAADSVTRPSMWAPGTQAHT